MSKKFAATNFSTCQREIRSNDFLKVMFVITSHDTINYMGRGFKNKLQKRPTPLYSWLTLSICNMKLASQLGIVCNITPFKSANFCSSMHYIIACKTNIPLQHNLRGANCMGMTLFDIIFSCTKDRLCCGSRVYDLVRG